MEMALTKTFVAFMIYSVMGWLYEITLCLIRHGKAVNRGFLSGPYCPIYGIGATVFIILLSEIKNTALLFVFGAVIATSIEYFTSFALEKAFGARWWDYSERRFNLNGRVCLGASAIFGLFAVILLKVIQPWLTAVLSSLPSAVLSAVSASLAIALIYDILISFIGALAKNLPESYQQKRLSKAFPYRKNKYD